MHQRYCSKAVKTDLKVFDSNIKIAYKPKQFDQLFTLINKERMCWAARKHISFMELNRRTKQVKLHGHALI